MAAPDGAIFPANPHFRLVGWSWKLREDKALSEPGFLGSSLKARSMAGVTSMRISAKAGKSIA